MTTVFGGDFDPETGKFTVDVFGGSINIDIGALGEPNGMTQLSDTFDPVAVSKDGSTVATMVNVEVDPNGYVHAIYDQGFTRVIYQIPVVDVPNANGLIAGNNQTYHISNASWTAPIEWSGLNVSAWWAFGPSGRWFPALGDGIPRRCAA